MTIKIYKPSKTSMQSGYKKTKLWLAEYISDVEKVKDSLTQRTRMDKKRKNSPLIKVNDAILIRTDKLSKKQVLAKMTKYIEKMI